MTETPSRLTIEVTDDLALQDRMAIEVHITLPDGTKRWCFFCNSAAMGSFGDWAAGTQIPVYNAPHMFVVGGTITRALIEAALTDLDRNGGLQRCTLAV